MPQDDSKLVTIDQFLPFAKRKPTDMVLTRKHGLNAIEDEGDGKQRAEVGHCFRNVFATCEDVGNAITEAQHNDCRDNSQNERHCCRHDD